MKGHTIRTNSQPKMQQYGDREMTKCFITHPLILENSLEEITFEELTIQELTLEELLLLNLITNDNRPFLNRHF